MKSLRQLLSLIAIAGSLCATEVTAQTSRLAMLDSARALIDAFNERQSIGLLRRALNPSLGAPDASWAGGVQLLGQTLLQTNQRDEAVAWLRWALRLSPSLQVDSVNFTPVLVTAFYEARAFVTANRTDPRTSVRFEWTTSTTSGGFGDLQVARGDAGAPFPLQLSANGDFLDEGRARRLAPGSYRIAARAANQPDAELTAEVLPGVTTVVTVNFVVVAEGMPQATERLVLSRLARIDHAQPGMSSCKVGFFAGGSGLLLASYSAIRGAGPLSLQLADGPVVSDRVRIADYSVSADLAVLSLTPTRTDSLPVSADVRAGAAVWVAHFPACGDTPSLARIDVASVTRDSITLAQDVPGADQSGVLVNASGSVTGLMTGPRSARTIGSTAALLAKARANIVAGNFLTTREVAQREGLAPRDLPPALPTGTVTASKKRSKKLPIIGGVAVAGLVAALVMPKSDSKAKTGGIIIRLP